MRQWLQCKDRYKLFAGARHRHMSHTRYIDVLGAGGVADPGLLGGKGESLCRLVSLGHRVPARFVITPRRF